MERSVQLIVAGGLALVAGLWAFAAAERIGEWHYGGLALVAVGVLALGAGIARDLTYGPFGG